MYSTDDKRSCKSILRLYNLTWIHAEKCVEVFHTPQKMSREKFFGTYFHSIVCHAAPQYELVSLRAVNAENEEIMFGQADKITGNTSNRHPNHVIPNLLLRVQAQAKRRDTIAEQETQIQKTAYQLPKSKNTVLDKQYLKKKSNSWQAHLTRISPYLIPGPGVWWSDLADSVEFADGPEEADFRPEGPRMPHFRNSTLQDLQKQKKQ